MVRIGLLPPSHATLFNTLYPISKLGLIELVFSEIGVRKSGSENETRRFLIKSIRGKSNRSRHNFISNRRALVHIPNIIMLVDAEFRKHCTKQNVNRARVARQNSDQYTNRRKEEISDQNYYDLVNFNHRKIM